jgi:DNA-binding response OmpR family regulator
MTTVLLVDDEPEVLEMLQVYCEEASYTTLTASDGREALKVFYAQHPDIVITDIRMPTLDGFELCKRIREISEVPIIVLSALGSEDDKVKGLQLGADDYLEKPVGTRELIARVEAALRRARTSPIESKGVYADGVLTIHLDSQETFVNGRKVDLTPKEMRLLVFLTQRPGKVVSVQDLLVGVWGSSHYSEESVKWHVASLRKKIEKDPKDPKLVVTVWGSGYRYDKPGPG